MEKIIHIGELIVHENRDGELWLDVEGAHEYLSDRVKRFNYKTVKVTIELYEEEGK